LLNQEIYKWGKFYKIFVETQTLLNLKEYEIITSGFKSNPDEYYGSNINFIIRGELLFLSTKNGSDKFKVALDKLFEEANKGINK
jgi:hypothetical protein